MANALGEMLGGWRQTHGWSLRGLAMRAGVSNSTLSRWESGKRSPSLPELEAVLDALKASPEQRSLALQQLDAPRAVVRVQEQSDLVPPVTGDLLKAMRLRKGMTQAELAQCIGVTQGRLGKWERSEDWPSVERLHALCFALQAHPKEVAALTCGRFWLRSPSGDTHAEGYIERAHRMTSTQPEALCDLGFLALEAELWQKVDCPGFAFPLLQFTLTCHAQYLKMYERNAQAHSYGKQALLLAQQGYVRHSIGKTLAYQVLAATTGNTTRPENKRAAHLLATALQGLFHPAYRAWIMGDLSIRLAALGQEEKAFACIREAITMTEQECSAAEVLMRQRDHSMVLGLSGRHRAARLLLQETAALEQYGEDPQVRHKLLQATFLHNEGHKREAQEVIETVQQQVLNNARLHYLRPPVCQVQQRLLRS